MWGEVTPDVANEIIEATGMTTQTETMEYTTEPYQVPGCITIPQQKQLF